MKKAVSLFLSLAIMLSVFTGCASGKENENENNETGDPISAEAKTLTAVIYDRGNDKEYWDAVISAFENENAGVTIDAYIGDDAAYILRDNILAGAVPDFVVLPSEEETGVTTALIMDKALLEINDMEQTASTLLLSGAMENVMSRPYDDGYAYLAPLFFETRGLICNKTLLEKNNWSVPASWEEFLSLGTEAKKAKVNLFAYSGAEPEILLPMFASAIAGADGTTSLDSLLRYTADWNTDSVKGIFENVSALSAYVASGSASMDKKALLEDFKKGNTLFIPGDVDILKELMGENSEEEASTEIVFDMVAYPKLNKNDDTVTVISFTEMYIPFEATEKSLAKKFLIFQYSDAVARLAAEKTGQVTPVLKAVEIAKQHGINGATLSGYSILDKKVTTPLFMHVSGANESLSDEFITLFSGLIRGDTKVNDAVDKLSELYEEIK